MVGELWIRYTPRYAVTAGGRLVPRIAGGTSTRGRTQRQGGVAFQDGAAGRTNPQTQVTRPGFVYSAGIRRPTGQAPAGGGTGGSGSTGWASLLNPANASTWRLVAVGLALAYVVGFHVTLNGMRLGLGPGR